MAGAKRALEDLPRVPRNARVLRLVNWRGGHWDPDAPPGDRLQRASMTETDCTQRGYGASFWLYRDSASPNGIGIADLEAADSKFERYGVLRILVGDVEAQGVTCETGC